MATSVLDPLDDYEPPGEALPVDTKPAESTEKAASATTAESHGRAAGSRSDGKASMAASLVFAAKHKYDIVQTEDGQTFAVAKHTAAGAQSGPTNVAVPLRGSGGLGAQLRLAAYDSNRTVVPSAQAVADALATIDALGCRGRTVELHQRVVHLPAERRVVIDLGRPDGAAALLSPAQWEIVPAERCPVLFRRSRLTREHPTPDPDASAVADLVLLRRYLTVTDADWPLLVGWLVAAHLHGPTPVLLLTGPAGSGKSSAARVLIDLIDPQDVPLRQAPRDEDQLTVAALGTAAFAWDNVSKLPPWLSDALCQLVTGAGRVTRALYTDTDVVVSYLRRTVILTSIAAGALRGDLATRLLPLELSPLSDARRTETDLEATWAEDRPRILGALFTLICRVLAVLDVASIPAEVRSLRMADFAPVLTALDHLDEVAGIQGDALASYISSQTDVQVVVAEGDSIASAIDQLLTVSGASWRGSWAEYLTATAPFRDPADRDWPVTGQQARARVARLTHALAALGIDVDFGKSNGARWVRFERAGEARAAVA